MKLVFKSHIGDTGSAAYSVYDFSIVTIENGTLIGRIAKNKTKNSKKRFWFWRFIGTDEYNETPFTDPVKCGEDLYNHFVMEKL